MGTGNIAALANCKRCRRMHMRAAQAYCADCADVRLSQRNLIYKSLQHHGVKTGVPVDVLAHETGVTVEEIEAFFLEGQLGTMADALLFTCATCKQPMRFIERNGRLCIACSRNIAEKTGVRIRAYSELQQEDAAGSAASGGKSPSGSLPGNAYGKGSLRHGQH